MKEVEVEALMTFKYSPNGSRLRIVEKGLEFFVSERLAKKLTAGDPPRAKYLDESNAPNEEIVEDEEVVVNEELEPTIVEEEVVEEIVEDEKDEDDVEIDLSFDDDQEVEINGELVEEGEKVEEHKGDYVDYPSHKTIVELDELKSIIEKADKKEDEVELGPKFTALRKGGAWFNVYNKVTDEVENGKGMKLDEKMAEFVYELYTQK